jgi:Chitobiase/beta-hexosaminidase C-terminal domain
VLQGSSGTASIATATSGGFDAAIALTATGQPAGVTVNFSPMPIPAPGAGISTMTIAVPWTAASGTYTITVSGTGGGITQTTTVSLTVSVPVAPPPFLSPPPSTYHTPQSVTLTDATPGVTIYYTMDGSTVGGGFGASPVASATYTFASH